MLDFTIWLMIICLSCYRQTRAPGMPEDSPLSGPHYLPLPVKRGNEGRREGETRNPSLGREGTQEGEDMEEGSW